PQARETVRLDDQEEDDEPAEYHQLEIRNRALGDAQAEVAVEKTDGDREQHRQQRDERAAEKRPQYRPDAPDDHHEQDAEREIEIERFGLYRSEIRVRE